MKKSRELSRSLFVVKDIKASETFTREALSAQVALSHPETLYVFFEESIKQYSGAIEDRALLLLNVLNAKSLIKEYNSINDIIALWKSLFNKYNIEENIKEKIKYTEINLNKITDIIIKDKVLIDKESPITLTYELVQDFVKSSLTAYTLKDKKLKFRYKV